MGCSVHQSTVNAPVLVDGTFSYLFLQFFTVRFQYTGN